MIRYNAFFPVALNDLVEANAEYIFNVININELLESEKGLVLKSYFVFVPKLDSIYLKIVDRKA